MKTYRFSFVPNYGDPADPIIRARYGYLEAAVSIVGNGTLFVMKFILGMYLNSIALIADSVHTLSDVGTSAVVFFGFKFAKKPSDTEHPFGHGRVEYIATLVIAVLLFITGFEFIIQSIERIQNAIAIIHLELAWPVAIIILISAVAKELMARFSISLGRKIKSDVLIADAWHHRSDALASLVVSIGIIGSLYGYTYLDPIFGIIVSCIIIVVGIYLGKTSANFLIGQKPDDLTIKKIEDIAKETKGVKGVHDISIHDYGSSKVVTLHVEVDDSLLLEEAHAIADVIEKKIQGETTFSTIIHVEPAKMHGDSYSQIEKIESILKKQQAVINFHKIQIIRRKDGDDIAMHLVVNKDMSVEQSHVLCHKTEAQIKRALHTSSVNIHVEPCINDCMRCTLTCHFRIKK